MVPSTLNQNFGLDIVSLNVLSKLQFSFFCAIVSHAKKINFRSNRFHDFDEKNYEGQTVIEFQKLKILEKILTTQENKNKNIQSTSLCKNNNVHDFF